MATTRLQVHWAKCVEVQRKAFGDFHTTTLFIESVDGDLVEVELYSNAELPRIEDKADARVVCQQCQEEAA